MQFIFTEQRILLWQPRLSGRMLILLLGPHKVELEAVGSMYEKINRLALKTDRSLLELLEPCLMNM